MQQRHSQSQSGASHAGSPAFTVDSKPLPSSSPTSHAGGGGRGKRIAVGIAVTLAMAVFGLYSSGEPLGATSSGGNKGSAAANLRSAAESMVVAQGYEQSRQLDASQSHKIDTNDAVRSSDATVQKLEGALRRTSHVLLVSHDMFMQGAQFFLFRLALGLRDVGWSSVEFLSPADGPMRKLLNEQGFYVHVAKDPVEWLAKNGAGYALIHYNTVIMCWAYLHAAAPPDGSPQLPGRALWTVHESKPDGKGLNLRGRCPHLDASFDAVDGLYFASYATQDVYKALGYVRDGRSEVLRYGIEIEPFDRMRNGVRVEEARAKAGIPAKAIVVMSVGTLCPRKGQLDLARAFLNVLKEYNEADPITAQARPLHLYLVGAERQPWVKKYESDVEEVAARPDAHGRIHIIDRTETAEKTRLLMRSADIHALHASDESMPFVCLETMALGVPQVATGVFGIPELVRDGQDGFVYPYSNTSTAQLEQKLLALIRDPVMRSRLGRSAAERIRAEFTVPRMAAAYDRRYLDAIAGTGTGGSGAEG